MKILSIESSCDDTCAAVVEDGRYALSNVVASQVDTHALYGGVVPEIASRAHSEAIWGVTREALKNAGCTMNDIDAVAVTNCPGLIGALLVGVNFAKSLAFTHNVPLIPVHHIRAHVAASYTVFNGKDGNDLLEPPFTALVASGGHTSLLRVNDYTDFTVLGATRDDAAGECFDKAARLLGMPYPGGAKMDAAAYRGNPKAYTFSDARVKDFPLDFSFSGLKTSAVNTIHNAEQKGESINADDFSASFTAAVVKAILTRVECLFNDKEKFTAKKFVIAGGVAANSHLREGLTALCKKYGVKLYLPPKNLCGDNGVMSGAQGYYEYMEGKRQGDDFRDLSVNAYATKECDESRDRRTVRDLAGN